MKKFYIVMLLSAVSYNLYSMEAPVHEEVDTSGSDHELADRHERDVTDGQKTEAQRQASERGDTQERSGLARRQGPQDRVEDRQEEHPRKRGGLSFSKLREQRDGQADATKSVEAIDEARSFFHEWYGKLAFSVEQHDIRVDNYDENIETVSQLAKDRAKIQKPYKALDRQESAEVERLSTLFDVSPVDKDALVDRIATLEEELDQFNRHVEEFGEADARSIHSRRGWKNGRRTDVKEPDFGTPEVRTMLTALGIENPADMTVEKMNKAFKNLHTELEKMNEAIEAKNEIILKTDAIDGRIANLQNDNYNVDARTHVFEKYRELMKDIEKVSRALQKMEEAGSVDKRNFKEKKLRDLLDQAEKIADDIKESYHMVVYDGYEAPVEGALSKSGLQKLLDWISDVKHHLFGGVHADVAQASSSTSVSSASFEN